MTINNSHKSVLDFSNRFQLNNRDKKKYNDINLDREEQETAGVVTKMLDSREPQGNSLKMPTRFRILNQIRQLRQIYRI